MLIMGYNSGQYISNLISFLELQPTFECSTHPDFIDHYECAPFPTDKLPGFCDKPEVYYRVDWSSDRSLHNWYEALNLTCVPKSRVGLLGSSLFIGWTASAIVLPRLSDLYGRKIIFIVSMVIQAIAFAGFFVSRNIDLSTGCMFLMGVASVGRCSISYLYMMELLPANRQVLFGTIL